jgi:hypothetical protein
VYSSLFSLADEGATIAAALTVPSVFSVSGPEDQTVRDEILSGSGDFISLLNVFDECAVYFWKRLIAMRF